MKRVITVLLIGMMFFGCAAGSADKGLDTIAAIDAKPYAGDPNYIAYQQALLNQPPLLSIVWTDDGQRMKALQVHPAINIQQRQHDPPHPMWQVVNKIASMFGVVGGIYFGGQAVENIVDASRGTTSITGSYNQPGGAMAGGDVSIPTTTTTTTETVTDVVPETEVIP